MIEARAAAVAAGHTQIRMDIEAGCYEAEAKKGGRGVRGLHRSRYRRIVKVRKDED